MHDLRVADIGAGTWFVASAVSMAVDQSPKFHRLIVGLLSIWLTELSDLLPSSAQLDAFDISASQYPPQEWLPHNISLHIHNAFSPFPQDALAKYDVVHVQCFITLIANDDPAPLIEILMSLLSRFLKHQSPLTAVCLLIRPCCATEPGGFLQWNEIDAASGKIITPPNKSVSTSATNRFIKFMKNPQVGHSIRYVMHHTALPSSSLYLTWTNMERPTKLGFAARPHLGKAEIFRCKTYAIWNRT